jgi:hypothetical protein
MAKNVNLNKLRDEIDTRKKEKNMVSSGLGEHVGAGVAPRDVFLNGLIESLHSGRETAASSLVKSVDNKVAAKHGEVTRLPVNEVVAPVQHQAPKRESIDMSPERDEQLFADLEKKRKQTLAESMSGYINAPNVGAPMSQQVPIGATGAPMQLNEQYLAENVKKIVNGYLTESLGPIFEEAIKGTIIEMYAVERIKEVLHENKDLIRTVVIETIKDIQAKSKAKAQ